MSTPQTRLSLADRSWVELRPVLARALGSYIGRDRGIPVLTIEVLKGSDPQAVWDTLRPALLQAISG